MNKKGTSNILVSVIVPAYNVEHYIETCIYSILNQTHKNIELVVIDDGSKDSTGEILDKIAYSEDRIIVAHKNTYF